MRCDLEGVHGEPTGANGIIPLPACIDTLRLFEILKNCLKCRLHLTRAGLVYLATLYLRENSDEPTGSNVPQ